MKNAAILLFALLSHINAFSQVNLEGQLGCSNFLGLSLNTEVDIALSKTKSLFFSPSLGLGFLAPTFEESTAIPSGGSRMQRFLKPWSNFRAGCLTPFELPDSLEAAPPFCSKNFQPSLTTLQNALY